MIEEIYEIYVDASWKSILKTRYAGAYVVYLNGLEIQRESYIRKCKNNDIAEFKNLNLVINKIKDDHYNQKKNQSFIFKSDCLSCVDVCSKIKDKSEGYDKDYSNVFMHNIKKNLIVSIGRYGKNNLFFEWIPRDRNTIADRLATECYKNYLMSENLNNTVEYMKADLEYTLRKWQNLGFDNQNSDILKSFKNFIEDTFNDKILSKTY